MTRTESILVTGALVAAALTVRLVSPAAAQPSADQVLSEVGLSGDDRQRVLNGEFVTNDLKPLSDRDLAVSIIFLVKTSPDHLAQQIVAGTFIPDDPQVKANGEFNGGGSLADLAGLKIDSNAANTLQNAQAGDKLNLATSEIAAFNGLQGGSTQALEQQLRQMLLTRMQAYQGAGLAGIAPYDRGDGDSRDVAGELRGATAAASGLKKHMPGFYAGLVGYPQGLPAGTSQTFRWFKYDIDGTPTYVLSQGLVVADGAARAVVQRQFYVSTGYNCEQAVAGFLPVQGGTVVVYSNHTSTDQVAGFGGSMKRSIGAKMMLSKLKQLFDTERQQVGQ